MLARFDESVAAEHPDLILWQVGTNAVLRDHALSPTESLLHEGLRRMRALGADVVLIDPQYAPMVLLKAEIHGMIEMLATTAKQENIGLFQRFKMMGRWYQDEARPFDAFVAKDGLHMNDWGYGCLAKSLGAAIAEAATRPVATVSTTSRVR